MYNDYENDYVVTEEELDYISSEDDESTVQVDHKGYYSDFYPTD